MMDLANEIVRKTYHKSYDREIKPLNYRTADYTRDRIRDARRIVLSDSMSRFVAELANVPFNNVAPERREEVLSSLRHSAKLPFKSMFVQLDGIAFREALVATSESKSDFWGNRIEAANPLRTLGWLLERGTAGGGAFETDEVYISEWYEWEGSVSTLPFYWVYKTGDDPFSTLRDAVVDTRAGMFGHGITGLHDSHIGVMYPKPLKDHEPAHKVQVINEKKPEERFDVHALVPEFGGVVRHVLGFLAAFNVTPKTESFVSPTKQYVAGGQYRKQLPHDVIHLNLPGRATMRSLAKRIIAGIRKGHHEVRAHWRVYGLSEDKPHCSRDAHIWTDTDPMGHARCKACDARRVWITVPEGRGDKSRPVPQKSRYYITHD